KKRETALPGDRQLALLHVAIEQVVRSLVGDHGRELERPGDLQVRGVAEADRERFSLFLERVELLELPLPPVQRFVQLHEVDMLTLQAAQRGFERPTRVVVGADLGRDRDSLAVRLRSEEHTSELQSRVE